MKNGFPGYGEGVFTTEARIRRVADISDFEFRISKFSFCALCASTVQYPVMKLRADR